MSKPTALPPSQPTTSSSQARATCLANAWQPSSLSSLTPNWPAQSGSTWTRATQLSGVLAILLSASCHPVPLPQRVQPTTFPTSPPPQRLPLSTAPDQQAVVVNKARVLSSDPTTKPATLRVSLAVDGPLSDTAATLSHLGVNLSIDPLASNRNVRGHWIDQDAEHVLRSLASQLGAGNYVFVRDAGYYVGQPAESDLELAIFAVPEQDAQLWSSAYRLAGTGRGETTPVLDRVIARDTIEGIRRMQAVDRAFRASRPQYAIDVTFVELSETDARQLGVDWNLNTSLALTADFWNGRATLAAILRGDATARDTFDRSAIRTAPRLICIEGGEASLQDGQTIPVPRRPTIIDGVVTDSGFDEIDTGVLLRVQVRKLDKGLIHVTLDPEVSQISGFRGDYPIVSRRQLHASTIVQSGSVVVLGGLDNSANTDSTAGIPGLNVGNYRARSRDRRRLFIFLTVQEATSDPATQPAQ
jgi:type II secretory pathway component GspD/PulD (secretin)